MSSIPPAEERRDASIRLLTEERDRYRDTLQRLADEDTWILREGYGGGPEEELHVRTNLARQALGADVCGCSECTGSLGLEPDITEPS